MIARPCRAGLNSSAAWRPAKRIVVFGERTRSGRATWVRVVRPVLFLCIRPGDRAVSIPGRLGYSAKSVPVATYSFSLCNRLATGVPVARMAKKPDSLRRPFSSEGPHDSTVTLATSPWYLWLVYGLSGQPGASTACVLFRMAGDDSWYAELTKPDWAPSVDVFAWVWIGLFLSQFVAVWHVWIQREEPMARLAVKFFMTAMGLNILWILVFFGLKNAYCGLIEIVVVWMAFLATLSLFWQRSRVAGSLLFPSFLWITICSCLNFMIWQMNP